MEALSPRHRDEKMPAGSAEGHASGDPRQYLILPAIEEDRRGGGRGGD
jgi:hypothetical protein